MDFSSSRFQSQLLLVKRGWHGRIKLRHTTSQMSSVNFGLSDNNFRHLREVQDKDDGLRHNIGCKMAVRAVESATYHKHP